MLDYQLKALRLRDDVDEEEEKALRWMVTDVVDHPVDRVVVHAGQELRDSLLLVEGWMGRAKDLASGQRQITELQLPGDFIDLHGLTLKSLDHDLITLSPSRVAVAPHDRIRDVTARFPHLARMFWLMTNIDASIQREWALSLGRRTALSSMANLFCELFLRLEAVGLTTGSSYEFPLTQSELGDCLSLTPVHVNRMLQELRRMDLIQVEDRRATILDLPGLKAVAEFDAQYLYLERQPR